MLKSRRVIFILTIRCVCTVFVIDQFFYIFLNPRWIPIITNNCFVRNIIGNYVLNGFVEQIHFLVNITIYKTSFSRKLTYCFSDIYNGCRLIIPNFPFIWRWIINFEIEFCISYFMMAVFV